MGLLRCVESNFLGFKVAGKFFLYRTKVVLHIVCGKSASQAGFMHKKTGRRNKVIEHDPVNNLKDSSSQYLIFKQLCVLF